MSQTEHQLSQGMGLPDFFRYNLWANLRLLDACAQLSDTQLDTVMPGTFGSIRETLMHMLGAEEDYVRDLTGTVPTLQLKDFTAFAGFDELRRRAERTGKALITAAEQNDLSQVLHLPENYDAWGVMVAIQALSHAIEHRSQIASLLNYQGIKPPRLDGWGYNNAMRE